MWCSRWEAGSRRQRSFTSAHLPHPRPIARVGCSRCSLRPIEPRQRQPRQRQGLLLLLRLLPLREPRATRIDRRSPRLRCCLACEGTGRRTVRRRRSRKYASAPPTNTTNATTPSPGANLGQCKVCGGVGLLPGFSRPPTPFENPAREGQPKPPIVIERPLVAIVGGGIGGFALALALQQRGMGPVRVYERDGDFHTRSQGYGLTLQQGAVAVRALGILDEAKRAGVSSRAHLCLDATSARELGRHGSGVEARRSGQNRQNKGQNEDDGQDGSPRRGNVHLPRQALRALLCGGLDDGIVRWGCELTNVAWAEEGSVAQGANSLAQGCSIEPSTAPPELIFNGGRLRVRANLVVGADGIRSATRRLLLQQREASVELRHSVEGGHSVEEGHSSRVAELTPLEPLGVMVILGFAPCSTPPLSPNGTHVVELLDGVSRLYAMPFTPPHAEGLSMWQLSYPCAPNDAKALARAGGDALLAEARRRCTNWSSPAPELLAATDATAVSGYPIYDRARESERAARGVRPPLAEGVVLIGDAAHPMAPFKGQGANQALLDALSLARALYDSELGDDAADANRRAAAGASDAVERRPRRRRRRTLRSAIDVYEREAWPRAAAKVAASRKASDLLHSAAALATAEAPLTRAYVAAQAERSMRRDSVVRTKVQHVV